MGFETSSADEYKAKVKDYETSLWDLKQYKGLPYKCRHTL